MTHVTCRLTAKNRDQLRNPTLGNRVWATFTFTFLAFGGHVPGGSAVQWGRANDRGAGSADRLRSVMTRRSKMNPTRAL